MLVFFQSNEISPVSSDCCKNIWIVWVQLFLLFVLRILLGSCHDHWLLFHIMMMLLIGLNGDGPFSGMFVVSSTVKTDVNWSFNIFAMSNDVVAIFPQCFRVPMPIVSCFLDLINLHNVLKAVSSSGLIKSRDIYDKMCRSYSGHFTCMS